MTVKYKTFLCPWCGAELKLPYPLSQYYEMDDFEGCLKCGSIFPVFIIEGGFKVADG